MRRLDVWRALGLGASLLGGGTLIACRVIEARQLRRQINVYGDLFAIGIATRELSNRHGGLYPIVGNHLIDPVAFTIEIAPASIAFRRTEALDRLIDLAEREMKVTLARRDPWNRSYRFSQSADGRHFLAASWGADGLQDTEWEDLHPPRQLSRDIVFVDRVIVVGPKGLSRASTITSGKGN